jgi:hypothetical protein
MNDAVLCIDHGGHGGESNGGDGVLEVERMSVLVCGDEGAEIVGAPRAVVVEGAHNLARGGVIGITDVSTKGTHAEIFGVLRMQGDETHLGVLG